jgi:hypothetical protein
MIFEPSRQRSTSFCWARRWFVEGPDHVQELKLFAGIKAQVADELAEVGPVLLLDVHSVVIARTHYVLGLCLEIALSFSMITRCRFGE